MNEVIIYLNMIGSLMKYWMRQIKGSMVTMVERFGQTYWKSFYKT